MLCSKCKTFSMHLSNFDSFICEYGHVICRTCSENALNCKQCSVCDGRVVRRTEFHLKGIPKTIFRMQSGIQSSMNPVERCRSDTYNGNSEQGYALRKDEHFVETKRSAINSSIANSCKPPDNNFDLKSDSELSDSSTVAQHLSEFRRATSTSDPPSQMPYEYQKPRSEQTVDYPKVTAITSIERSSILDSSSSEIDLVHPNQGLLSKLNCQVGLSAHLRDKLKNEIYSCFDEKQPSLGNSFMVKGDLAAVPSNTLIFDATVARKEDYLTNTIRAEVEKALKNLDLRSNCLFRDYRRRDEIIQQSKYLLRQRILEELYSPFNRNGNCVSSTATESSDGVKTESQNHKDTNNLEESINHVKNDNVEPIRKIHEHPKDLAMQSADGTVCTVESCSTASHPQLAINSSILCETINNDSKSFTGDVYIQETSIFQPSCSSSKTFPSCEGRKHLNMNSSGMLFEEDSLIASNPCPANETNLPTESEKAVEVELPCGKTVYFCETFTANNFGKQDIPIKDGATSIDSEQVGDCLEAGEYYFNDLLGGDMIQFIKRHYPHLRFKDLKNIVRNICPEIKEEVDDTKPEVSECLQQLSDTQMRIDEGQTSENLRRKRKSIATRAYFSHSCTACCLPPQYKVLPPWNDASTVNRFCKEIPTAQELQMSRSPVICPISSCKKLVFVTEFARHMKCDHSRIHLESMYPGAYKNIFLDPKLGDFGINRCNVLFLLNHKIKNLGSKDLKDYLPVALMSTRISVANIAQLNVQGGKLPLTEKDNCIMIWLTGNTIPELSVYYTLIAWSRNSNIPRCHIAHTGHIYSVRNNQDYQSVFKSGQCLLLKYEHWMLLSNEGKDLLELQVVLY